MKTAVLITGPASAYPETFENQRYHLYSKLDDPWFFVSVEDNEDAVNMEVLREFVPMDRLIIERHEVPSLDHPESGTFVDKQGKPANVEQVLRTLWEIERVGRFIKQSDDQESVVHIRTNTAFIGSPRAIYPSEQFEVLFPFSGTLNYVTPNLAVMGKGAAIRFFNLFSWLRVYGYTKVLPPFTVENILDIALSDAKIETFSILPSISILP